MGRSRAVATVLATAMVVAVSASVGTATVGAATPPAPRVFFAPSGPLTDGQTVLVGGDGFVPSVPLFLYECADVDCEAVTSPLATDSSGRFGVAVAARRGINDQGNEFDCAVYQCVLVASTTPGGMSNISDATTARSVLTFGPKPTMTLSPSTHLEDGQAIEVEGEHLVPGQRVSAFECQDYANLCTQGLDASAVVDPQGRVAMTVKVVRWIHDYMDDPGDLPFDCAVQICRLSLALTSNEYTDNYFSLTLERVEFALRPSLAALNADGSEGTTGTHPVTVNVAISPVSARPVQIRYRTLEWTAHAQDFDAASGTLTVPAGATRASVTVNVRADTLTESLEEFFVEFQGTGRFRKAHAISIVRIFDAAGG